MRYILLSISLFPLICFGQYPQIDSLNSRSFELRSRQKDSSFLLAKEAFELSDISGYKKGLSRAKLNLGMFYLNRDSLEKASSLLIECHHEFSKNKDEFHLAVTKWYLAKLYFHLGESEKSEGYFRQSARHFEDLGDKKMELYVKNGLGVILILQQRQSEALEIFEELLVLAYDPNLPQGGRHHIYNNISQILLDLGRNKEALTYVHRAMKDAKITAHPIVESCRSASIAHYALGNIDSAYYYIDKSLEIGKQRKDLANIAQAYFRMADYKKEEGDLIAATQLTRLGLEQLKNAKGIEQIYHAQNRLALLYENKNLIDSAIFYTKISYNTAKRGKLTKSLRSRAKKLSNQYETIGAIDSAHKYLSHYVQLTEEAYADSAQQAFNKAQIRLAVNEKKLEIEDLQAERKKSIETRNYIIVGICLVLVIIALIVINYMQRVHRQKVKSEKREKELNTEIEEKRHKLSEYALQMVQRNQGLDEINNILASSKAEELSDSEVRKIQRMIKSNRTSEQEWEQFGKYFGDVHRNFFQSITKDYPTVSTGDLRNAALVRLNLTLKESSTIMGVSPSSIKMARNRLKKKMNIGGEKSLKLELEKY